LDKMKIGTIITGIAILVVVVALAYMAGAASAREGGGENQAGLLSQLRMGREDALVSKAMRILDRQYYKVLSDDDKEKLKYGAVDGMMRVLHNEPFNDKFSNFYDPELYADLQAQTTGEYAGVGVLMGLSADGMYPEVVTVFDNTPAQEEGVRQDDIIVEVDGEDTFGMILPKVATAIKGEPGTTVELKVYRPDDDDFLDFTLERRNVEFSSVAKSEMVSDDVGLVEISSFAENTLPDFRAAVDSLLEQGMQVLIIDLRNNTGGLYEAALDIANCFLEKGTIVKVHRRDSFEDVQADPTLPKYHLPLVILQNSSSASASEILTAALQENGLAKVVGEKSFGKGVIQAVMPLEYVENPQPGQDDIKSALAITIGSYLTPNGNDIHGKGIEPNVWYDSTNQLHDDAKLRGLEDKLEAKREETRGIRSEMATYVRDHDAPLTRAEQVADMLLKGEDVPDVPQMEPEEQEHAPLGHGSAGDEGDD